MQSISLKQGLEEGTPSLLGAKGIGKTKNRDGEPLAGPLFGAGDGQILQVFPNESVFLGAGDSGMP